MSNTQSDLDQVLKYCADAGETGSILRLDGPASGAPDAAPTSASESTGTSSATPPRPASEFMQWDGVQCARCGCAKFISTRDGEYLRLTCADCATKATPPRPKDELAQAIYGKTFDRCQHKYDDAQCLNANGHAEPHHYDFVMPAPPPPQTERSDEMVYWVIENAASPPAYWDGRSVHDESMVTDHANAVRFRREADAEVIRCWLLPFGKHCRSVQHMDALTTEGQNVRCPIHGVQALAAQIDHSKPDCPCRNCRYDRELRPQPLRRKRFDVALERNDWAEAHSVVDDLEAELSRRQQEIETLKAQLQDTEVCLNLGQQEIDRLRQAQTWQPISSAPRDGTLIIARGANFVTIARVFEWDNASFRSESGMPLTPTHWLHLPAPPQEDR